MKLRIVLIILLVIATAFMIGIFVWKNQPASSPTQQPQATQQPVQQPQQEQPANTQ